MKFGAVAGILAALIIVIAFAVPVRPRRIAAMPAIAPATPLASTCLTLEYDAPPRNERLPNSIELQRDVFLRDSTRIVRRARATSTVAGWVEAMWVQAGADSIDVWGYHTAMIRIPRVGASRAGRGVPFYSGPLLIAFLEGQDPDFKVKATEMACPQSGTGAA